jgi:hypothetical protein
MKNAAAIIRIDSTIDNAHMVTSPAPGKKNHGATSQSRGHFISSPDSQMRFPQTADGTCGWAGDGIVGVGSSIGGDGAIETVQFCVSIIVSFLHEYALRKHVRCCVPFVQSDQSVQL